MVSQNLNFHDFGDDDDLWLDDLVSSENSRPCLSTPPDSVVVDVVKTDRVVDTGKSFNSKILQHLSKKFKKNDKVKDAQIFTRSPENCKYSGNSNSSSLLDVSENFQLPSMSLSSDLREECIPLLPRVNCITPPSLPFCSKRMVLKRTISPGTPSVQKRKFPGPAGLLPNLDDSTLEESDKKFEGKLSALPQSNNIYSQASATNFISGPWKLMLEDLGIDEKDELCLLNFCNIHWVQRRASLKGSAALRKVPLLLVVLKHLDTTHNDATVTVKDRSGEMNGTLACSALEKYQVELQPNSVLILKDVTILSPISKSTLGAWDQHKSHYLNITLKSIAAIYSYDGQSNVICTFLSSTCVDALKILLQKASEFVDKKVIIDEVSSEEHVENHSLFLGNVVNLVPSCNKQFTEIGNPCFPSPSVERVKDSFQKNQNNNNARFHFQPVLRPSYQKHNAYGKHEHVARLSSNENNNSAFTKGRSASLNENKGLISSNMSIFGANRLDEGNNKVNLNSVQPNVVSTFDDKSSENELDKLLDDIDADSFFGDF